MTPGATTRMAGWLESAWLARYLDRQLEGEELAWFEAYLLDKPELLAMVEADNGVRDAVAAGAIQPASGPFAGVADTQARGMRARMPNDANRGAGTTRLAWAAMLALGLGVGWLGHGLLREDAAVPGVVTNPMRMVFDTMRGAAEPPIVERAGGNSSHVLIEVAIPANAQQVQLLLGDEPPRALVPSADGFASFLVAREVMRNRQPAKVRYLFDGRSFERILSTE